MFSNIKNTIRELAHTAVITAEKALGSQTGKEKKRLAVEFVVSNIPLSPPFKKLFGMLLSGFIDDAVEFAVMYMNSLANE